MFKVRIVHISDRVIFDGESDSVSMQGVEGEFEVGDLHAPLVAVLAKGHLLVRVYEQSAETGEKLWGVETVEDAKGRLFRSVLVEQGLAKFDGQELLVVTE